MEEIQRRHAQELQQLELRVAQKRKGATKKTRKGVDNECNALQRDIEERHAAELSALNDDGRNTTTRTDAPDEDDVTVLTDKLATDIDINAQPSLAPQDIAVSASTNEASDAPITRRPNRARARLERRKAEQDALYQQALTQGSSMPDRKRAEREAMLSQLSTRHLTEKEIRADGHCLYSAFADQMAQVSLPLSSTPLEKPSLLRTLGKSLKGSEPRVAPDAYRTARHAAADYIQAHPDDFSPFLEEPLEEYVVKVRDTGEWGGQLELMALARHYSVQINVLQGSGRVEEILPYQDGHPEGSSVQKLWMAYYRHGFGLGEHYNSLHHAAAM